VRESDGGSSDRANPRDYKSRRGIATNCQKGSAMPCAGRNRADSRIQKHTYRPRVCQPSQKERADRAPFGWGMPSILSWSSRGREEVVLPAHHETLRSVAGKCLHSSGKRT